MRARAHTHASMYANLDPRSKMTFKRLCGKYKTELKSNTPLRGSGVDGFRLSRGHVVALWPHPPATIKPARYLPTKEFGYVKQISARNDVGWAESSPGDEVRSVWSQLRYFLTVQHIGTRFITAPHPRTYYNNININGQTYVWTKNPNKTWSTSTQPSVNKFRCPDKDWCREILASTRSDNGRKVLTH